MRLGHVIITAGLLAAGIVSADATTRAVVVGVSGYPNLPEGIRLVGPKNDSRAFANMLVDVGVKPADIAVLADGATGLDAGVANLGPGTKKAVLDAMDKLVEESQPGDLAVFYFSGHGSRQPDTNGDEEGGQDEIFLAYDVGHWDADGVKNAIVDDELGERVQRMLAKGVDFFGVIDACHSATGFRAVEGDDVRERSVDPAVLGVPAFTPAQSRKLLLAPDAASVKGRGRAAFFYAAQEVESALEREPADSSDGQSYGVFTYELLSRLNRSGGMTYRTLHQAIVADIKKNTLMSTQTPELEGELLDDPVLRIGDAGARRQWQIYNGKLQAGALNGLTAGSRLALYAAASDPDDKPVAYGSVDTLGATRSVVAPAAAPCPQDGSACPTAAAEGDFKKGRFARLVEPGVDLALSLSEPIRVDPKDGKDYSRAIAALKAALASGPAAKRVSQRKSGYDIAVALVDGTLAFAPAGGLVDRNGPGSSPRLTLPDDPQAATAKVSEAIERMARATALQRLGGDDGARALGLDPRILVSKAKSRPPVGGSCSDDKSDFEPPVVVADNPTLSDCDILSIAMTNTGEKPLDVTVLLVAADFSITPVWPRDGNVNRIFPQDKKTVDVLQMEPNPKTSTEERLVFLAVPGVNKVHTDFANLEQDGLRAAPDDAPEIADVRDFIASGLNDMDKSATSRPPHVEEDMSVDIKPFVVMKGGG